jgi:hypothetical protein
MASSPSEASATSSMSAVNVQDNLEEDFKLVVGSASESVRVTANGVSRSAFLIFLRHR